MSLVREVAVVHGRGVWSLDLLVVPGHHRLFASVQFPLDP